MPLSKDDLIEIVQSHYRSSNTFLFTLEPSLEENRRQALWSRWIENREPWKAFRAKLRSELPHYETGATYSSADGGPRCIIYPPRESLAPSSNWIVVGCVSLLAPVYFVYGVECNYAEGRLQNDRASFEPPPSSMALPTQIVARTIETMFSFSALPHELAQTPVPLYAGSIEPPQTTLFHTLFTNEPSSIP